MKKILFLMVFLHTFAYAQSPLFVDSEQIKEVLGKNVYEPNYVTLILGLFAVIFMIYLTGFLYQKLTKVKFSKVDLNNKAQIISTTTIGQGRSLHVIKIGSEYCLIGSTQNNITYLKDVKIPDEIDKQFDEMMKQKKEAKKP